ncbi:MAG: NAD(P)H-hydrate dehydratase [Planctomycetes bacterium]|nr:NAD(P)H-hydrate dehydratase [Planctomycetota bacterium]
MPDMKEIRAVPALPARPAGAHKGDFGRVAVLGGSVGMSGAPMLAARAALRSGAGLVELAVPWSVWIPAAAAIPCALVKPLTESPGGAADATAEEIEGLLGPATAACAGPGMGTSEAAGRTLALALARLAIPAVLDADALNLLAASKTKLRPDSVLTPHPGEMARLAGIPRDEVQARRRDVATSFAREHGVVLVLKGPGTLVTDGDRLFVNETGTQALARGGTGDVLAGMLAALLARKMTPFDAAVLAVHAHGLAGEAAARRLGAMGMTADDVVEELPGVWKGLA